ncbi:MAG: hypothetical protein E7663_05545 [Ruminococcaceae bacterium]|nr:hypothetical protein [Oscillospiraceae bacterium]
MFGYVRIQRSELRVREYEYYRATYCGLCRSMGKCTGQCSRLSLSYDFAFLATVRMVLTDTAPSFRARRCIAHPLRRRRMMESNAQLSYAARASALLAYEKCRDDVADRRGISRLLARIRCLFFASAYRRARKRLPALALRVRECLSELSCLERERVCSVSRPAELFGKLLAALLAEGLEGTSAAIARAVGDAVGRFIYTVDAADDLERDRKSGNYNPFLLLYGGQPSEQERASIKDALLLILGDLEAAFDLIEDREQAAEQLAIMKNILYLGMPAAAHAALFGGTPTGGSSESQPL